MSERTLRANAGRLGLGLMTAVLLASTGCFGTKHKGKAKPEETGQAGFTNWFGTSVTPQVKSASTNAPPGVTSGNTAENKRENSGQTLTPFAQGESQSDRRITQDLRKAIVFPEGAAFSFPAKNIKIITVNSVVTLRGVVEDQNEKERIDALAKKIPGVKQVNDQLEIAGAKATDNRQQ